MIFDPCLLYDISMLWNESSGVRPPYTTNFRLSAISYRPYIVVRRPGLMGGRDGSRCGKIQG